MKHVMFCLFVSVAGCTKAAPPPARVNVVPASATTDAGASIVPSEQRGWERVVDEEGGVLRALVGPLRVEARGVALTPAEQATTRPIAFAVRAARGWLFATDRGEVYRSDTFTGTLSPLRAFGSVPPPAPPPPPSTAVDALRALAGVGGGEDFGIAGSAARAPARRARQPEATDAGSANLSPPAVFASFGRAALATPDGRTMLWSDGDALHALDVPDAVAHAWTSESRGAVIVGYRTLKSTRDGGRTWREVDLGTALPLGVAGRADGLYVETSEGVRRIGDDDALTPAMLVRPRRRVLLTSTAPLFERGYARAAEPTHASEPERDEPANAWRAPYFVAQLPLRRVDDYSMPSAPRGAASPFGTVRGRAFARAGLASAVVSITRPDGAAAGHPVELAWRGADERGPFTARVATTAPAEMSAHARWSVVAATRAGLLCMLVEMVPGEEDARASAARALYWFAAAGARRVGVEIGRGASVQALALDDGGAMLLARQDEPAEGFSYGPSLVRAVALGPDGSVRAQRAVVDAPTLRTVLGLGERGGRWGVVTAERATPATLTLLALDGASEPFGAWTFEGMPAVCGARTAASARLHLLRDTDANPDQAPFDVAIGPQFDGPTFAYPRLATFERGAVGAPCVRRVWGVRRLEDEEDSNGNTFDEMWGAVRLTARGGRLVAVADDGRTVATFPMSLTDEIGFDEDI